MSGIDTKQITSGTLPLTRGGTGQVSKAAAFDGLSPATTKGDLVVFSTTGVRRAVGADGQVLTADSTQADGVKWAVSPSGTFVQSTFDEITTDYSSSSATFIDLLTRSITIAASSVLIVTFDASFSASLTNKTVYFRITIDGATYRATACRLQQAGTHASAALTIRVTGLSAGARSVKVQQKSDDTLQIFTVLAGDAGANAHHASLLCMEVTV